MVLVLTIDQVGSRRARDQVPAVLELLSCVPTLRPLERTAGDEVQGVLLEPDAAVQASLLLARAGGWSLGIGLGAVEEPLPASTRAGRGPAFTRAREAVEAAKRRPQRLAVRGEDAVAAADAQALLTLMTALVQRRSDQAWEAVDLLDSGLTMTQAAVKLGITRQAVGQRLAVAMWQQGQDARPAAVRLLRRAAGG